MSEVSHYAAMHAFVDAAQDIGAMAEAFGPSSDNVGGFDVRLRWPRSGVVITLRSYFLERDIARLPHFDEGLAASRPTYTAVGGSPSVAMLPEAEDFAGRIR